MEGAKSIEITEDVRRSKEYACFMERIGWKVVGGVFVRNFGPVAIAKFQRPKFLSDWDRIDNILKKERVFMCKVEPTDRAQCLVLSAQGFKQDNWPLLGTKTLRVDLRPSENEVYKSFKKDCRYVLRKIQDTKYKIQKNNFGDFYEIWKESGKRKGLWVPNRKDYTALVECFGKKCFIITVGGLAGALVLIHKNTAFYFYAGATGEGNKLNLPYLSVWEAMKESRRRGCRVWDFEGIYDPRFPNKGWVGFSRFKKSFGGVEIEFPGCFTKWRWPF
jgi:hypothetical protein